MTCFASVQTSAAAPDPTKHVNHVLGMVLGVDDLDQEFTYVAHRDQWLARDLTGYGTVCGLAVSTRDGGATRGPEVVVSPGVALNPRGQLIRVAPAQCASLNEWLKPRGADVLARRVPTANPNLFLLPLYLVLSYRTCLTDPVPIAGEPCRSEDDSTAPSRVADDFLLELRLDPPAQDEEDAVRELVQWLRAHVVVAGGAPSMTVGQFLDVIRAAAKAAQQAVSSPPSSPPAGGRFLLDTSPPTPLSVPAALLADYLRAVARLWVTELRPAWRPSWLGLKHACAGSGLFGSPEEGNQVLLASITPTIGVDALSQPPAWKVQGPITIDEGARPFLLHIRVLEEWLLTKGVGGTMAGAGAAVVAAGLVNADGSPTTRAVLNGLTVAATSNVGDANTMRLTFGGYVQPPATGAPQYVVKALPASKLRDLTLTFAAFQPDGLLLSISKAGVALSNAEMAGLQLMVEVTRLG